MKECLAAGGHRSVVIDCGILQPPLFEPDIGREKVAAAAGVEFTKVSRLGVEGKAIEVMRNGALVIA